MSTGSTTSTPGCPLSPKVFTSVVAGMSARTSKHGAELVWVPMH